MCESNEEQVRQESEVGKRRRAVPLAQSPSELRSDVHSTSMTLTHPQLDTRRAPRCALPLPGPLVSEQSSTAMATRRDHSQFCRATGLSPSSELLPAGGQRRRTPALRGPCSRSPPACRAKELKVTRLLGEAVMARPRQR